MAETATKQLLLTAVAALVWAAVAARGEVGVSYGMMMSERPSGEAVVALLKRHGIRQLCIYNTDVDMLTALAGTGISVMVGVMNEEIPQVAASRDAAYAWVRNNISPWLRPRQQTNRNAGGGGGGVVKISHILVGNEVFMDVNAPLQSLLANAIANIQAAVTGLGLESSLLVSTAHPDSVITSFVEPSAAVFQAQFRSNMAKVLRLLARNRAPFVVHIHPYFAFSRSRGFVPVENALFSSGESFMEDRRSRKSYSNPFDAIHDSLVAAMADVDPAYASIPIVVGETGWPTAGGPEANTRNAMIFNNNLMDYARRRNVDAYIFSLYDEDITRSRFDPTESHFGLFRPDSSPKYPLAFNA